MCIPNDLNNINVGLLYIPNDLNINVIQVEAKEERELEEKMKLLHMVQDDALALKYVSFLLLPEEKFFIFAGGEAPALGQG
jgi:hypothetical protein